MKAEGCARYHFASFTLDAEGGVLIDAQGAEVYLRPKSFALLLLMVENSGKLLSQELMMDTLWPDVFVTENNVTQCIYDIRRAFGSEGRRMLKTVPRRGYRFTADVMTISAKPRADAGSRALAGRRRSNVAQQPSGAPNDRQQPSDRTVSLPVSGRKAQPQALIDSIAADGPDGVAHYLASIMMNVLDDLSGGAGHACQENLVRQLGFDNLTPGNVRRIMENLVADIQIYGRGPDDRC